MHWEEAAGAHAKQPHFVHALHTRIPRGTIGRRVQNATGFTRSFETTGDEVEAIAPHHMTVEWGGAQLPTAETPNFKLEISTVYKVEKLLNLNFHDHPLLCRKLLLLLLLRRRRRRRRRRRNNAKRIYMLR